ncbi:MAG TPA: hypothetical protein DCO77_04250 [Nitrospiraceae bacterium]|nr:hypothetical protein [Nitrospiraceae bacterium]
MLMNETIDFLRKVPPFTFLTDEEMDVFVQDISLEYYPQGSRILAQDGPPSAYLSIVKKGIIRVSMTSDEGEEIVIDYRNAGEFFGLLSIVRGDRSRANVVAVVDTICYLIPKEKVLALIKTNPLVDEYFLKSFFVNFIDKTYQETRSRVSLVGDGERLLFTTAVGDIVRRGLVTVGEDVSIREAAQIMAEEKISSLIIVNTGGLPVGIVTDRDLREKVVAQGRDSRDPVGTIMSSPLVRVDASDYCFDTLLKMIRYDIHHLLVIESGVPKGVVTNHDFMVLQGSSPTSLVREIEDEQSIESLAKVRAKMIKIVSTLVREGARAGSITGLITEITEKLLNRIVTLTERKIGPPPLASTWFLFGEGGRREFTLRPTIRLGVVFGDTVNAIAIKNTERYYTEFGIRLRDAMTLCGLGPVNSDPGGILQQDHIRSFSGWQSLIEEWITRPFAHAPDEGFLEMRTIRGDDGHVEGLLELFRGRAGQQRDFMDYVAAKAVRNRPPLGFLGKVVVEKSGEHQNELDLFEKGIKPIVDSIRVFSLEKAVPEITTLRRLQYLKERYAFDEAENIGHALEYLFTLAIHHELERIEGGNAPDDFINPGHLGSLEMKTLKESFQLITRTYEIIEKAYPIERVA